MNVCVTFIFAYSILRSDHYIVAIRWIHDATRKFTKKISR